MYSIIPLRDLMEENDGSLETTLDSYHDCIGSDQEQFLKTKAIMMEKRTCADPI